MAMTVGELIEELQGFDPDMDVYFAYDYGDHCHTTVAESPVMVQEEVVERSEYHRSMRVVDVDDEYADEEDVRNLPEPNAVVMQARWG